MLLTFDDAVSVTNIDTYRSLLRDRRNSNNCPAGATFYVSHEYTNYQLVNELYNMGLEIALHSISHQTPQSYWAEASYDDMVREFADQVTLMSHFANIPASAMKGNISIMDELQNNIRPKPYHLFASVWKTNCLGEETHVSRENSALPVP